MSRFETEIRANLKEPQGRVLAVEQAAQAICELAGVGPDDGAMMCMTAAVHIAMRHSGKTAEDLLDNLAEVLGCAVVVADAFFPAKPSSDGTWH